MFFGFRGQDLPRHLRRRRRLPPARGDAGLPVAARADLPAHRAVPRVGGAPGGRRHGLARARPADGRTSSARPRTSARRSRPASRSSPPTARVVGDSMVAGRNSPALENHGDATGGAAGHGRAVSASRAATATRSGPTCSTSRCPSRIPASRSSGWRCRSPRCSSRSRRSGSITLVALAVALVGAAGLAWLASFLLGRRLHAIAAAARRVASGDLSQRVRDYERDELGTVARVLDDTVRELAGRVAELAGDRARTDAILAGHGRRRDGGRRAGPRAAGEPGGARDARPGRRRRSAATTSSRSATRRSPRC